MLILGEGIVLAVLFEIDKENTSEERAAQISNRSSLGCVAKISI
jgi:hypothetical protein